MAPALKKLSAVLAVLAFVPLGVRPVKAESAVKLHGVGVLSVALSGPSSFVFSGEASHLGSCDGRGEVTFEPGNAPGSLIGTGVADLTAANGDHIVGAVTWLMDSAGQGQIMIVWQDSVTFSDESIAYSTGRFATSRPPGVVATIDTKRPPKKPLIIIIAILIG